MPTTHIADPSVKKLRLWPGVALVAVQWLLLFGVPEVAPDAELAGLSIGLIAIMGGVLCGLFVALWWMLFSRAHWAERLGAIALMIAAVVATSFLVDVSIAGAGQGMLLYFAVVPGLSLALVVWAVATARLSAGVRRATLVAAILLACAPWTLLRTAGVIGSAGPEYHWRWTPTPEELLLAQADDTPVPLPPGQAQAPPAPVAVPAAPAVPAAAEAAAVPATSARGVVPAEWPGFRGPDRDGIVHGVRINTDWSAAPPVEMWRRPIGPGWSSFSVRGDLLYTQEQRGDDEIVSCYRVSTGEPVWKHRDAVRFWESNGGAGPRATPTLQGDRVYAFGATGILNALDAATGAVVWSGNVAADTGRAVPMWGFASSPLVVDDLVIVAAEGTLAAYDRATGNRRWVGPSYGGSYSSPHRATIDGVVQVLLLGGPGAISVAPADGAVLWTHEWEPGPIIQPAVMTGGDILVNAIAATGGIGTRRLHVTRRPGGPPAGPGPGAWNIEERWTSNGLKPYFNDFVVHNGHAFGFDGSILSSINLNDGKRNWKGGRYGNGQLILLPDQDVMLVLSEEGELALVSATAGAFTELARFPALDGKTWNHPVLVGDVLLVRNGEEMAAFRLVLQGR